MTALLQVPGCQKEFESTTIEYPAMFAHYLMVNGRVRLEDLGDVYGHSPNIGENGVINIDTRTFAGVKGVDDVTYSGSLSFEAGLASLFLHEMRHATGRARHPSPGEKNRPLPKIKGGYDSVEDQVTFNSNVYNACFAKVPEFASPQMKRVLSASEKYGQGATLRHVKIRSYPLDPRWRNFVGLRGTGF